MKLNLFRHSHKIPTCWGASPLIRAVERRVPIGWDLDYFSISPLIRTVERREQFWSCLYVGREYIGIEWGDSGISMNGKLYDIT